MGKVFSEDQCDICFQGKIRLDQDSRCIALRNFQEFRDSIGAFDKLVPLNNEGCLIVKVIRVFCSNNINLMGTKKVGELLSDAFNTTSIQYFNLNRSEG